MQVKIAHSSLPLRVLTLQAPNRLCNREDNCKNSACLPLLHQGLLIFCHLHLARGGLLSSLKHSLMAEGHSGVTAQALHALGWTSSLWKETGLTAETPFTLFSVFFPLCLQSQDNVSNEEEAETSV